MKVANICTSIKVKITFFYISGVMIYYIITLIRFDVRFNIDLWGFVELELECHHDNIKGPDYELCACL